MRPKSIVLFLFAALALLALTVHAQSDPTGGGLDPVTTPAPLPTRGPRPLPSNVLTADGLTLELFLQNLPQGETRLVRVYGQNAAGSPLAEVRARFLNNDLIEFYTLPDPSDPTLTGFWGILSAGMEQRTGPNAELIVYGVFADGTRASLTTTIPIVLGGFITQNVTVPPDRVYLLDAETERTELARLASLYDPVTPERRWDETGFQLPILSALTSPFGAFRIFNSTLSTRHTGWDIRTTLGQPVLASAAGRVIFAGYLDIRGDYVMIDHGYGIYSGYAHLSTTHVTRGQDVVKGQVIGTVGDTGRVSGPHFHWEMAVNDEWIDSVTFIQMWLP
jgi:hypothetical protein